MHLIEKHFSIAEADLGLSETNCSFDDTVSRMHDTVVSLFEHGLRLPETSLSVWVYKWFIFVLIYSRIDTSRININIIDDRKNPTHRSTILDHHDSASNVALMVLSED